MTTLADVQATLGQHMPQLLRQLGILGSFVRGEQTESAQCDRLKSLISRGLVT